MVKLKPLTAAVDRYHLISLHMHLLVIEKCLYRIIDCNLPARNKNHGMRIRFLFRITHTIAHKSLHIYFIFSVCIRNETSFFVYIIYT